MDPKELRGLMEAYAEMYAPIDENRMDSRMEKMPSAPAKVGKATHSTKDLAPSKEPTPEEKAKARKALGLGEATAMAKRGKDETAIRNKIASSTGGGQSADRAGALADRPTYGQSGTDPKARANYARKQMGDFRKTNSSNPGLHGYGHKSNDPDVKAKQAARGAQRGSATLTPNEKKQLNMGEAVKGASRHDTEMRKASSAERRKGEGQRLSPSKGKQNADKMERDVKYMDKLTKNNKIIVGMAHEELDLFDTVLEFLQAEGFAKTLEEAEWLMANVIDEEAIGIILGEAEGSYGQTPKARAAMGKLAVSRMNKPASEYSQRGEKTRKLKAAERHTRRQDRLASGNNRHGSRGPMDQSRRDWSRGADDYGHSGYDGDGYGGSVTKNPKKLRKQKAMGEIAKENYGEEFVDESQYARNNPEKYEREQSKKYAPVRGERTPMPPRGDKRREDFEKWYAANVR